jgi:hypothetical protein
MSDLFVDYWTGKDEWFDRHYSSDITKEFSEWWMEEYGLPESYEDVDLELHEYFIRMAFAFRGWQARPVLGEE